MTKHAPATRRYSDALAIAGRDQRIKDQTARLVKLQIERAQLVAALRGSVNATAGIDAALARLKAREDARALLRSLGEVQS